MTVLQGDVGNMVGGIIPSFRTEGELGPGWRGAGPAWGPGGPQPLRESAMGRTGHCSGPRWWRWGSRGPEAGALLWALKGLTVWSCTSSLSSLDLWLNREYGGPYHKHQLPSNSISLKQADWLTHGSSHCFLQTGALAAVACPSEAGRTSGIWTTVTCSPFRPARDSLGEFLGFLFFWDEEDLWPVQRFLVSNYPVAFPLSAVGQSAQRWAATSVQGPKAQRLQGGPGLQPLEGRFLFSVFPGRLENTHTP